ncbi:MAG: hypothetical protein PHC94_02625 [Methylobacter sp.]|nr:hypothetical protein [Methylobacter sp.]
MAVLLARNFPQLVFGLWFVVVFQGIIAAVSSRLFYQPRWWIPIHLLFLPAALGLSVLNFPSWVYLLTLLVFALVFWGTVKGDVPLFLSSSAVAEAMISLVKQEHADSFVELGAGVGSVVVPLAKRFLLLNITALERAPLPWLILRCRCRLLSKVIVQNKSLWACDLSNQNLVFAFLSPLFMDQLGEKVRREMRSGSLFVSSSFPVPGWAPESVMLLSDRRKTKLYCYRL